VTKRYDGDIIYKGNILASFNHLRANNYDRDLIADRRPPTANEGQLCSLLPCDNALFFSISNNSLLGDRILGGKALLFCIYVSIFAPHFRIQFIIIY
jgi:hypothetical protein